MAHIQLREQFAGSSIVYMQHFYFMMYAVLVLVGANTYLFTMRTAPQLKLVHYRDNLIPKLLFWPLLLLCMIAITANVLWGAGPARERTLGKCLSAQSKVASEVRPMPPPRIARSNISQ
jgi:hypothetical protein